MNSNQKIYVSAILLSLAVIAVLGYFFVEERSARIKAETEYGNKVAALEECGKNIRILSREFADFSLVMKDSIVDLQEQVDMVLVGEASEDDEYFKAFQFYKARSDQLYQELLEDQRRLSAYVIKHGYMPQTTIDEIVTDNEIPDSYDLYRVISDSISVDNESVDVANTAGQ